MTRSEYLELIHPLLVRLDIEPQDLVSLKLDPGGIEYVLFERDAEGARIAGHKRIVTLMVTSEE